MSHQTSHKSQTSFGKPVGWSFVWGEPIQQTKKTEVALCLFYSSLSGVQTGIPSGPSGGIPSPSVGSELRLCRPFATLFYLSTLPSASPSLPSAVGHSSVAVGIGNITKNQKAVNTFFKKIEKKLKKVQLRP